MTTQPKALRLADELDVGDFDVLTNYEAAAELRRLQALNADLLEALKGFMDGAEAMGWNTDKARAAIAKAKSEKKNPGVL